MVVKMMKWRPWPPLVTKKFEVRLVIRRLEGLVSDSLRRSAGKSGEIVPKLTSEIRWKGQKIALSSLRRSVKRNFTKEGSVGENGVVSYDEEFLNVCTLSSYKDNVFHPWEISITVFNGLNQGPKTKVVVFGAVILNIADFASAEAKRDFELSIPLSLSAGGSTESCPSLCVSLSLMELRTAPDPLDSVHRSILPVPSPQRPGETLAPEKDELSAIKAGLRKVKILTEYVSSRRTKKACRGEEGDSEYPFDTDSVDELEEEGGSEEGKEDASFRKSFSYGSLAYANCVGVGGDEDWVYYSNCIPDVGGSCLDHACASVSEQPLMVTSKRSILPWRKRKLSFRSPKAKGEPLLKKAYGEEGGDDIDFDRRQLSSDESLSFGVLKSDEDSSTNRLSLSEFGDDCFAVGCWEPKETISRDGHMKLQTNVFFASIDQRSERAAGESACTALVAVIADWLQSNRDHMPIKSQFDSLIREGSLEWRDLCGNEIYKGRFPDKHFDLETVLEANVRNLQVIPEKSFVGFFHPDGTDEEGFDFLEGAMSFDSIWEEVSRAGSEHARSNEPQVYIVSWNDHFFVLKVEQDAYYIIDTLGERLYEGCKQAFILKFDKNTVMSRLPQNSSQPSADGTSVEPAKNEEEEEVTCRGKECCKEYIKSFLAAIPIRELLVDVKKGLMASTPLHHRLQVEFHYTKSSLPLSQIPPA